MFGFTAQSGYTFIGFTVLLALSAVSLFLSRSISKTTPTRASVPLRAVTVITAAFITALVASFFLVEPTTPKNIRGATADRDTAALLAAALFAAPPQADCAHGALLDLDYLEIGTSDFNTQLDIAFDDYSQGMRGAAVARGVSVDALQLYLDRLPTLPTSLNRKLNYAVTGTVPHVASLPVYFIHPDDLTKYNLPDFLRGCNRVGSPHPLAVAYLRDADMTEAARAAVLQSRDVPLIALQELLDELHACRLGLLKLDVEGLDAALLLAYVEWLWLHTACFADTLAFEQKSVNVVITPAEESAFAAAIAALGSVGYRLDNARSIQEPLFTYRAADDARGWARRALITQVADAARRIATPGAVAAAENAREDASLAIGSPFGVRYLPAELSATLLGAGLAERTSFTTVGIAFRTGAIELGVALLRGGLTAALDCVWI